MGINAQRPRTGVERNFSGENSKTIIASRTWPLEHDVNGQKTALQRPEDKGVREEITSVSPPGRDGFAKRFGKLRKRRTDEAIPSRPQTGTEERTRNVSSGSRSSEGEPYAFIKAGGGGTIPGIDAPRSAVNAGDRVSWQVIALQLLSPEKANHIVDAKVRNGGMRSRFSKPSCNSHDDCVRSHQDCFQLPFRIDRPTNFGSTRILQQSWRAKALAEVRAYSGHNEFMGL